MNKPGKRDPRTKEQLIAEIDALKAGQSASEIAKTIRSLIWATCAISVVYFLKEVMVGVAHELAGKETNASVAWNFLNDFRVSTALPWLFGAGGVGYGYKERRLRKRTVGNTDGRIKKLEKSIDANRTSSNLTLSGDTNPEDAE